MFPSCSNQSVDLLRKSRIFSRGNLVDPKLFLVRISWVQTFFSWVFRWYKDFSCEYFVGPNFFFPLYFVGPIFFLSANFVIQRFSVVGCMERVTENKYINTSQPVYSIPKRFQQLSVLFILER